MGKIGRFMKGTMKTFVDVPSWLGIKTLKLHTKGLYNWVKPVLFPRRASEKPDFDEAMQRQGVTNDELKRISHYYYINALIFLGLGFLCIIYSMYLLFNGAFFVSILAILLSMIIFMRAFGFHFFYFEIKHRKLGCTFREWLNGRIKEGE
jgi:intracellular multiplication protein IcmV